MTTIDAAVTNRIPELEHWLDLHQVAWTFDEAFPVDDIDHTGGLANQARLEPLNEAAVEQYAADMAAGAIFPPIVLRDRIPVGGNHRTAAARRAGRTTLAAYLVHCDDDQAHLLAIEDNRRHGLPLSDEERVWHALALHRDQGHTLAEAAKAVGITAARLQVHVDAARALRRAFPLAGFAELPAGFRQRIGAIRDEAAFQRAAQLAVRGRLTSSDAATLVTKLNAAGADPGQLLDDFEADTRRRVAYTNVKGPAAQMHRTLHQLLGFQAGPVVADEDNPDALHELLVRAARHLMAIDQALEAR